MKTAHPAAGKGDLYEAILIASTSGQLWGLDRSRAIKRHVRSWLSQS